MAEAQLTGLLRTLSGNLGNFTFRTTRNGIVVADRHVGPTPPTTAEQEFVRAAFSTATKAWQTLSIAQRAAWKTYANTYFPTDKDGVGSGPSGQAVFIKATWYRLASGQTVLAAAPTTAPPAAPSAVSNGIAGDPDSLVVNVSHAVTPVTGYRLFVEITPALASPARNPQPSEYRAVRGLVAASFPALAASGSSYTFTPIRFPLDEGARFGIQVTIVSPAGIPSQPLRAVLVQQLP